jgi:adenylate cyclase
MEIERKFLVKGEFRSLASHKTRITQGYLSSVPERTVRIRIHGDKGFLTIKGKSSESGASRFEWEKEITPDDAGKLLELCEQGVIDKFRYLVYYEGHTFEVDEFYGDNQGLVIAEIELGSEDEPFERPAWLGEEVTGDSKYYNSMLTKRPFKHWNQVD